MNKLFKFFLRLNKKNGKTIVLKNVFKTKYNKKILLSYVRHVFDHDSYKNSKSHTNHYTTYIIGEILNELGYDVDAINHDVCIDNDFSNYDLVIGLGATLEHVLKNRNSKSPKVIWFGTGCNPFFSNPITLKRISDFYAKNNVLIPESSRFIKQDDPLQHELADWIILHGKSFSKSTYRSNNNSFTRFNITACCCPDHAQ